jgi:hypothetical protein
LWRLGSSKEPLKQRWPEVVGDDEQDSTAVTIDLGLERSSFDSIVARATAGRCFDDSKHRRQPADQRPHDRFSRNRILIRRVGQE